ncbi:MAG: hypothetical protein ABH863_05670, partial [Candidatus Micrarchaeota archaeon]
MEKNRLLLLLFNLGFALFFLISYFFPRETGFWLVFTGSSVIIIEFYVLCAVLCMVFLLPYAQIRLNRSLGIRNHRELPPFEKDPKLLLGV